MKKRTILYAFTLRDGWAMRKTVLALLMVTSCASQAKAVKGQANVTNTVHNLSVTAPPDPYFGISFYETNEDEVCIFCHTPHGGTLDGPLWNRSNPTSAWTHYNSATLSAPLQALSATRAVGSESLLPRRQYLGGAHHQQQQRHRPAEECRVE
jgi:hypothetical protein